MDQDDVLRDLKDDLEIANQDIKYTLSDIKQCTKLYNQDMKYLKEDLANDLKNLAKVQAKLEAYKKSKKGKKR